MGHIMGAMHYIVIHAYLPFLAAGNLPIPAAGNEYFSESSVCPAITANVQAIVDAGKSLGCCCHDACPPLPGGAALCAAEMVATLQHCTEEDYDGDRAACIIEMVKEEAPAVCGNMWQRCEALRTLNKHLQLAQAVSGCPSREGKADLSSVLALFGVSRQDQIAYEQALIPAVLLGKLGLIRMGQGAQQILNAAEAAARATPILSVAKQGLDDAAAAATPIVSVAKQGLDDAAAAATPIVSAIASMI